VPFEDRVSVIPKPRLKCFSLAIRRMIQTQFVNMMRRIRSGSYRFA
jgi:hypothetical protein